MPRISYIDIAKGILISLLVLHHLIWTSVTFVKVPNDFLNTLYELQMPLFVGYFIQAFFVISGFCTNSSSLCSFTCIMATSGAASTTSSNEAAGCGL